MNNLLGQKFGRLTAIEKTNKRKNRLIVWKCQCECGNICYAPSSELKRGNITSCGCINSPDITGQKINGLTVLEKTDEKLFGSILWRCKCDCGKECLIKASQLYTKSVYSCGCQFQRRRNLIGEKFGKLTVINETNKRNNGNKIWLCKCECGNKIEVPTRSLINNNTQSCGCRGISLGEYKIETNLGSQACSH